MRAEEFQGPRHKMHHAKRMSETAVFGALIGEHREAELLDAAKPLELRGVYQLDDQTVLGQRLIKRDDVVKRISVVSLRQPLTPFADVS